MHYLETIWEYTPKKPRKFRNEKQTYEYFKRTIGMREGFKLYSPVLRGHPDFVITVLDNTCLDVLPGYYEVKFGDNTLRETQTSVMAKLAKIAPCYVVNIYNDGYLVVRRFKLVENN